MYYGIVLYIYIYIYNGNTNNHTIISIIIIIIVMTSYSIRHGCLDLVLSSLKGPSWAAAPPLSGRSGRGRRHIHFRRMKSQNPHPPQSANHQISYNQQLLYKHTLKFERI